MIKHGFYIVVLLAICLFASCKATISADDLYGRWKYIKVQNPNANPPDSVRGSELAIEAPYIQFTKNNRLTIIWGGKVLSQGNFSINGHNINYTESLPDGSTRKFPFWVSELTDREIIFETKGDDGSRVTAVKE